MQVIDKEKAIRAIVRTSVKSYAAGFSDRHIKEYDDEDGVINMKINNVFIAALGSEIQYYSALSRSLDSSLGNMLEKMAIEIASLSYTVTQHVEGVLYQEQTNKIAQLLEEYKRQECSCKDFWNIVCQNKSGYNIVLEEFKSSLKNVCFGSSTNPISISA